MSREYSRQRKGHPSHLHTANLFKLEPALIMMTYLVFSVNIGLRIQQSPQAL